MIEALAFAVGALAFLYFAFQVITSFLDRQRAKPVTVLVCGATGVGKSTLVNAIAGRAIADVGKGAPVTQNTTFIEIPESQLAFYDSKGLEVEEASQTYLLLLSDLLGLRYTKDHFRQLDLVLVCISEPQARIDDAHEEIAALCTDMGIPFGIGLTKAEDNFAFREVVSEKFADAKFIQPVRALPLKLGARVIEPEGLEDLVANLRKNQQWNSDAARARRAYSSSTEQLAVAARALATSQTDSAWRSFAETAYNVMLRPRKKKDFPYWAIVNDLRDQVRKKLVPGFFDRVLLTKFDNAKIDAALARRLVPKIVQAFTNRERTVGAAAQNVVASETSELLRSDRPYRSRF